ncbi:MAG TPA: CocE/NonD family hydrolase [Solirubrobacteraceae bacterium]|nr:CocE/NonD family hydrolase [Solirubrobacteraceae bacterium]
MRPLAPRLAAPAAVLVALALLPGPAAATGAPRASFTARGSVGEAYVLGARRGAELALIDRRGRTAGRGRADRFGSLVFHDVRPGAGYTVRVAGGRTRSFPVLAPGESPPASSYRRTRLKPGLNYVKMRDGVELAMTVRLPPGRTLDDGPLPTLVEYSGYQVAAPHDLLSSVASSVAGGEAIEDPLAPATSTAVGSLVGPLLDFAVVSVQMRGSGCSGGAFDFFGLPTTYDGYDAVETVAAQPWVKGGKVGMAGISFSGISQLFTAGTRPPHLAAIAPMSVSDDFYSAVAFPGGIFNDGFTRSWIEERMSDARPAPAGGQPYARVLTRQGDRHCRANQRLRLQTQDFLKLLRENPFRTPGLYDARSAAAWIGRIDVPAFLVGQFQDEQTGGHFAESLAELARNPKVWISMQNGVHVDSLGPSTATRWVEFLDLYVAGEIPEIPDSILGLGGDLYRYLADAGAAPLEQSRFAGTTDVAAARAAFERDPRVRLLMDNGGGPAGPGSIGATWELGFDAWPPREARPTAWYLGDGGALTPERPGAGTVRYTADPRARPRQTLPGDGADDAWKAQPPYDWAPIAAGKGVGFTTPALERDTVIAGPTSLDLHLRSTAPDTDLQVTLSEVRPDGHETYVQNGWLRASHRRLDRRRSTALDPVPSHLRRDAAPLPAGRFAEVRVPVFPVAHAFRAGSRIRVTVAAPGGDRARWQFATVDRGRTRNTIALGPSRLVLPVVPGATAQGTPLPGPTALRGEPDRAYRAASNGG